MAQGIKGQAFNSSLKGNRYIREDVDDVQD